MIEYMARSQVMAWGATEYRTLELRGLRRIKIADHYNIVHTNLQGHLILISSTVKIPPRSNQHGGEPEGQDY